MLLIVCDKTKRKTEERLKKTHIESGFSCSSARNWFPRSRSESAAWSLVMFQIVLDCPWSCSDWLHDESNSVSGFEHPGIGRESTTSGLNMFLQKVNWIAHWTCSVFRSNSKSVCVSFCQVMILPGSVSSRVHFTAQTRLASDDDRWENLRRQHLYLYLLNLSQFVPIHFYHFTLFTILQFYNTHSAHSECGFLPCQNETVNFPHFVNKTSWCRAV